MPVIGRRPTDDGPRLIERLDDLVRQRSLFQIRQVLVQLLITRHADNDPVVPALVGKPELRMMHHPSQRRLHHRQPRLLHRRLDDPQRLKRRILEVPFPVQPTHGADGVTVSPFLRHVRRLVFPAEDAAGNGVVGDVVEAEAAEDGEEFLFGGSGEGVVHSWRAETGKGISIGRCRKGGAQGRTLVQRRSDPAVVLRDQTHLGDFGRGKVGNGKRLEFPGAIHLVDGLERFLERRRAVRLRQEERVRHKTVIFPNRSNA